VFLEFVGFYPVGGGVFLAPGETPDLRAAEYRVGVDGVDPYALGLSSSARQRARCSSGIALIGTSRCGEYSAYLNCLNRADELTRPADLLFTSIRVFACRPVHQVDPV
jgi:hypothetical protein